MSHVWCSAILFRGAFARDLLDVAESVMLAVWGQGSLLTWCQLCSCRGDKVAILRLVPLCHDVKPPCWLHDVKAAMLKSWRHGTGPCWSHDVRRPYWNHDVMTPDHVVEIMMMLKPSCLFWTDAKVNSAKMINYFLTSFFRRSIPLRNALQLWLCHVPRKDSPWSICLSEISRWCYTHSILVLARQLIPDVLYYPLWR